MGKKLSWGPRSSLSSDSVSVMGQLELTLGTGVQNHGPPVNDWLHFSVGNNPPLLW